MISKSFLLFALLSLARPAAAEWFNIDGQPAKWNDIIRINLRDLHPTQPSLGFDRVYYKLGRYEKDRRKMFEDYCEKNGQRGVRDFSAASRISDTTSFGCVDKVGTVRELMKTVVIAPNGDLYLTDGHHTFNGWWEMPGGGPNLAVNVIVSRDYRDLASMDDFWKQMQVEQNVFLLDDNDHPITVAELPTSLGLEHFKNSQFRSLLYFTRRIAWTKPGEITVPDADTYDERYPGVPFLEFYWMREARKAVSLADFDLNRREGYVNAIRAVGNAILNVKSADVGGSKKSCQELGQFNWLNEREITRLDRPGTGKLAYMLEYKAKASEIMASHSRKNMVKTVTDPRARTAFRQNVPPEPVN